MLLGPIAGVTITPARPTSDGLGNLSWTDRAPITNAVFALDPPATDGDSIYTQTGSLFVPRGSDIGNGDRVVFEGRAFVAIGVPLWDMDHPMTGEDFGYMEVRVQWGGLTYGS